MKTIRINIDKWFEKQDKSWRALSLDRQRRYALCLFLVYLLLTAVVILKVWYDTAKSDNRMVIEHIDNPVRKKESPAPQLDTLSTKLKEKIYERK
ncbi:nitrogen regulatory IIA protein [Flavobacterium aquidurense]|uniref:nitrogen regulatory IIA protein n=1 Tax=Flavobacterium aquidurense TaxID=362413 RepID=UPI0037582AB7